MSGREKTIKTQKMVENIANCSNHISKGSRSIFARQLDRCFYKQDLKMAKIWVKIVPKSLTYDQRDDVEDVYQL